jgi:hypothetical protein
MSPTKPDYLNISNTLGIRKVPEIDVLTGTKNERDWYVSHNARWSSNSAEGTWDQWVALAKEILSYAVVPYPDTFETTPPAKLTLKAKANA